MPLALSKKWFYVICNLVDLHSLQNSNTTFSLRDFSTDRHKTGDDFRVI